MMDNDRARPLQARETVAVGEAARRLGVSTATVQRWVDRGLLAAHLTAGGHRRVLVNELHRLMTQTRSSEMTEPLNVWLDILLSGNTGRVHKKMRTSRAASGSWSALADEIAAVVVELGQLWELGRCAVYEEHVATEALRRAAARCTEEFKLPDVAPKALLLTVEGESHTLGLSFAELVLGENGWGAIWIGEGPPIRELLPMVRRLQPDLVVLTATARARRRAIKVYEAAMHDAVAGQESAIVAAGGANWSLTKKELRPQSFAEFGTLLSRMGGP